MTSDRAATATRPARDVGPASRSAGPTTAGSEPATPLETAIARRLAFEPHSCFACGTLNAQGLQLELHVDGERCWTDLRLPARFQGWEGIAHGGIACTILDEVMAWSLVDQDNWGLTARLEVAFKRPIELDRPIHAEGWIVRVRRRLIETAGRIVDVESGETLATAEATYVAANEERKAELKRRYGFLEGPTR